MNFFRTLILTICFFGLVSTITKAQTKEKRALITILTQAEKQYNVTFTFVDEIVKNITIKTYNKGLNLPEVIHYLENNTNLNFIFLNASNILINKKNAGIKICGNLIDINTKKFIEGAHIAVLNSNLSTVTGKDGFFELPEITKNQVIEITHLTYPSIYINSVDFLKQRKCLTISLTQKIEKLTEIIITNYLTSGITVLTNNDVNINTKEFGILPGLIEPDVLHQIQSIPGISSVNETISTINIRGGTNDQNLLLWDGIKMYHSGHFFGLISAFNPYLIKNVTITKNGTSAQYNDAVSGTINMQTVNSIANEAFGGAGFNLLSADAYGQIPVSKNLAIQFSGRRSVTDLLDTPTFKQYFKRAFQDSKISTQTNPDNNEIDNESDFSFYDYNFKILYNLNTKHKLRVNLLNVKNNLDYNETLTTETLNESKTSTLQQRNLAFGVQLDSKWNKKFNTLFNAYYTKYNIYASNYTLLTEQRLLQNNEVLESGFKFSTNYQINKNLKILNGYHFYELGISNAEDVNIPLFIRTVKNVIRNHAVFSEINYVSKNNKTFFNTGIRLNYIEKFGDFIVEPRFQALHKLTTNFSIKAAGEFKSQYATQIIDLQEDFLGVEKRRWVLADKETIPIVKSKQASVGFNYKKNSFFIDVEGFYKAVNGITTSNQGFQNQNQFVKTSGKYDVYGLEFLINKKSHNFSSWLSYTYNKNNYTFNTLIPASFPNNLDIRHTLNIGNTYTYNNIKFALGLLWRTGKPFTTPNENNPVDDSTGVAVVNYNSPNSARLKNYLRADFSSTYEFNFSEKVQAVAGISILNMLNTRNILNTYYEVNTDNGVDAINNLALEATPNFTFRVSF